MKGLFWEGTIEDNCIGLVMAEVFKDGVYFPYLAGKKDLTIVDLGANIGITSLYFSPFCKDVYSVEPAEEHFNCLKHMIEFNKITNIHPLKYAISDLNKEVTLHKYRNKTAHNLTLNDSRKTGDEMVEAITIDKLFEIAKIKHCDFMKMDIEGEEFKVLAGKEFEKVSPIIDTIFVELHTWASRNFNQAKESLRKNGYQIKTIPADASLIVGFK